MGGAEIGTFSCPMPFEDVVWNEKCKEHFWMEPGEKIEMNNVVSRVHVEDRESGVADVGKDGGGKHEPQFDFGIQDCGSGWEGEVDSGEGAERFMMSRTCR